MADRKPCLLLLSGASLVGTNVQLSLADRRDAVRLHATNSSPSGATLGGFDGVFLTPTSMSDVPAFERRILQVIERIEPDLVIPCRDDDVLLLAQLAERRPDLAPRLLCGSSATARATHDKYESWLFSVKHGLPFAPCFRAPVAAQDALAFAALHGYPLIVKPVHGFASRDVWLAMNEAQLLHAAAREGCLVQRYLGDPEAVFAMQRAEAEAGRSLFHSHEGIKHSIQAVIGPDGVCAGMICAEHVMRHGASVGYRRYDGADADQLGQRCVAAFAAAGWRGPLNIQCQRAPDGEFQIYEYNGRMTGGTAARLLLGLDEVALLIRLFTGISIPERTPIERADHVVPVGVPQAEDARIAEALTREGEWSCPRRGY